MYLYYWFTFSYFKMMLEIYCFFCFVFLLKNLNYCVLKELFKQPTTIQLLGLIMKFNAVSRIYTAWQLLINSTFLQCTVPDSRLIIKIIVEYVAGQELLFAFNFISAKLRMAWQIINYKMFAKHFLSEYNCGPAVTPLEAGQNITNMVTVMWVSKSVTVRQENGYWK